MENAGKRSMENCKWTAFMKLKGQTMARREKEILDQFDRFVQSLRGIGVGYNIIVMVEGGIPRQLNSEHNLRAMKPKVAQGGSGA